MSLVGTSAQNFSLPGTDGDGEFNMYHLSEYTEDGAAVLAFYPFDFSPVCISELCAFRDAEWLMMRENVTVFGISRDSCYPHKRFIQEYNLPFPLLADVEGDITEAYGIKYDEWELHSGVPKRAIFVVDDSQTIQYEWVTDDAYTTPDLIEVADAISSLSNIDLETDDLI